MLEPAGPPPMIPTSKSGTDEFISAAFSQMCWFEMRSWYRIWFDYSQSGLKRHGCHRTQRRGQNNPASEVEQVPNNCGGEALLSSARSCFLVDQKLRSYPSLKKFAHSAVFDRSDCTKETHLEAGRL